MSYITFAPETESTVDSTLNTVTVFKAQSSEQVGSTGCRKWIGDDVDGLWVGFFCFFLFFSWLFFCNHITVLIDRFYLL